MAFGALVVGIVVILVTRIGCAGDAAETAAPAGSVAAFLDAYTAEYLELRRRSAEADWALNTRIVAGDTTLASRSQRARLALAAFAGSRANVETARGWLSRHERGELHDVGGLGALDRRQLEAVLRAAAEYPETAGDAVADRVRLETSQVETLFGFDFRIDGRPVSTNEIDAILRASDDEALRLDAWLASKEVGAALRPGVLPLAALRNRAVREVGFDDYFDFKAAGYGLDRGGVGALSDELIEDVWPLYREIHTWARYELADRYGVDVPDYLPAHWLPDRWGQDWSALVEPEGSGLDGALADRDAEWIVREAERFYISLGFEPLPETFWERSSMYPAPPDAPYRKNNHASAWHIDLERDVRTLMSVEPNARWYETTHHELGHIYYYLSYARPGVPHLLRTGANRAFHEAIGSLLGLAATQDRFLAGRGLLDSHVATAGSARLTADISTGAATGRSTDAGTDAGTGADIQPLFREALRFVAFMPWSAGVMTRWESELYAGDLDEATLNSRWWELKLRYQGIVPPIARDERHLDAASKTHVTNDPAEYYDYAFSHAILFQLHGRIAGEILGHEPHDTDYWGSRETGDFLRGVMESGATRPWEDVLEDATGRDLDGRAVAEYFEPLLDWLRERNAGRRHTLPERP
ncbi:MAG: M2 family metallopeptidase [Gemmatimonadota bacterium]|nr:M2 family metallopeptidase [Gemmatimonadota bacterium]